MKPATAAAYKLLHDGALALARAEATGIRIDEKYLDRATGQTDRKIIRLEKALKQSDVWKVWQKDHKIKANLDSADQLGKVLFGTFKLLTGSAIRSSEMGQHAVGLV